jgi:hypothetical protein
MGILLAFMFVWNMVGAVILIPALSHFLLPSTTRLAPEPSSRDAEDNASKPESRAEARPWGRC